MSSLLLIDQLLNRINDHLKEVEMEKMFQMLQEMDKKNEKMLQDMDKKNEKMLQDMDKKNEKMLQDMDKKLQDIKQQVVNVIQDTNNIKTTLSKVESNTGLLWEPIARVQVAKQKGEEWSKSVIIQCLYDVVKYYNPYGHSNNDDDSIEKFYDVQASVAEHCWSLFGETRLLVFVDVLLQSLTQAFFKKHNIVGDYEKIQYYSMLELIKWMEDVVAKIKLDNMIDEEKNSEANVSKLKRYYKFMTQCVWLYSQLGEKYEQRKKIDAKDFVHIFSCCSPIIGLISLETLSKETKSKFRTIIEIDCCGSVEKISGNKSDSMYGLTLGEIKWTLDKEDKDQILFNLTFLAWCVKAMLIREDAKKTIQVSPRGYVYCRQKRHHEGENETTLDEKYLSSRVSTPLFNNVSIYFVVV